jgi:UPF0755 protein
MKWKLPQIKLRYIVLFVAVFVLLTSSAGIYLWVSAVYHAPGPLTQTKRVVIPKGFGLSYIAEKLEYQGVITHPYIFMMYAKWRGVAEKMKAGEFEFSANISQLAATDLIVEGKTVVRSLTVIEGLRSDEIIRQIMMTDGLDGLIRTEAAEGELLPETYHFSFGDDRDQMVKRMKKDMVDTVNELWAKRDQSVPFKNIQEAITLASIVEKETGVPLERSKVAAVFINRLKIGMPLQADPAIVYAAHLAGEDVERGSITANHLKLESPYNTYLHAGLPPGPICNPGKAALAAVLNPAQNNYLYFVADGTGGHAFAENLEQHNRNVLRWRQVESMKKK